jgi:hypothetical protein
MHRSGASMVARLLNLCDLYLGQESDIQVATSDNEEGYCENIQFVRLNEAILEKLGGGWDWPPIVTDGWDLRDEMVQLRHEAAELI